jgi:hypothetical protein
MDPDGEPATTTAARVATAVQVSGGALVSRIGASVVAAFDPMELDEVIELALGALSEADDAPDPLAVGLAVGEVSSGREPEPWIGDALDRAQLLSNRARDGELILDEVAHARAQDTHLFLRVLSTGTTRGHQLDRRHPLKCECRAALAHLHPVPLPSGSARVFDAVRDALRAQGPRRLLLTSTPPFVALDWLGRLQQAPAPPMVLRLARQGGGLQPLGGLALALRRARGAVDATPLAPPLAATLERLEAGAAVARDEAARALSALLAARAGSWVVLEGLREIDPASVQVCADALRIDDGGAALLAVLGAHDPVPEALLETGEPQRFDVAPLDPVSAREVALEVLGPDTDASVARRVALLGGDTALGVREAARTLICAGDLIHADSGFRWRGAPRTGSMAVPTDALITERIHGLSVGAKRLLEAVCVAPPGAGFALILEVAALDGLGTELVEAGLDELRRDGWLDADGELGALTGTVRSAVRNDMPPGRASELHRFVAAALAPALEPLGEEAFGRALLARHLAEGGREEQAAAALLGAARGAGAHGFEAMAVRLAAFALRLDGAPEVRKGARAIARAVDRRRTARAQTGATPAAGASRTAAPPGEAAAGPQTLAQSAIRKAIAAIARGNPTAAEGLIDTAVAAGWGRGGAQRLWAMALLARGELREAVRTLERAGDRSPRRRALAAALILLEAGQPMPAVRSALEGLASAQRAGDDHGVRAARLVLAACYRALGRAEEADRIEAAAA